MTTFGTRLKAERLRLGLTQMELAEALDIHVNSQSGYETGANSPTADYLEQIAARGFNINYLFYGMHDQIGVSELVADIMAIVVTLPPSLQAVCFAMVNMFRHSSGNAAGISGASGKAHSPAVQAEDFFRAARLFDNFLNLGKPGKEMVELAVTVEGDPPASGSIR